MFFKPKDWKSWSEFLKKVRLFFEARNYLEVETPYLVPVGAFESSLDCLKVQGVDIQKELHTSPEIEMKVLMTELKTSIFQICRSYRDDPATLIHFKEFHMLEFYSPGHTYRDNMALMKDFLNSVSGASLTFESYSLAEAFQKFAGLELLEDLESFKKEMKRKGAILFNEDDSWDDLFYKVLIEKIEPQLNPNNPTFLYHFPPSQAALAALSPSKEYAERFEIYWQGIELCNGCTELTDLEELQRRFNSENQKRIEQNKKTHAFPASLAHAMKNMPACSGVAVGLERLYLCLQKLARP